MLCAGRSRGFGRVLLNRVHHLAPGRPGQRVFAVLVALAGLYWMALGLQWV